MARSSSALLRSSISSVAHSSNAAAVFPSLKLRKAKQIVRSWDARTKLKHLFQASHRLLELPCFEIALSEVLPGFHKSGVQH